MIYFSGFALKGESKLFEDILSIGVDGFVVAGFSYGAILALEHTLKSKERVDRLILISPALFSHKKERFIKLQLDAWSSNQSNYISNFLKNVAHPSNLDLTPYQNGGTREELEELLRYEWSKEALKSLQNRGVDVEVFLGGRDKIVDSRVALEFFRESSVCYFIKDAGHILRR
jgi:pimeloyl-ACP methyl ester carboxylesterase